MATIRRVVAPVSSPTDESLKVKYQEMHSHYRMGAELYIKATLMALTITGVGLGFILQSKLPAAYVQVVSGTALTVIVLWYVCSALGLRFMKSIAQSIEDTAYALGLRYEKNNYRIPQYGIWAAMIAAIPFLMIFITFVMAPPTFQ